VNTDRVRQLLAELTKELVPPPRPALVRVRYSKPDAYGATTAYEREADIESVSPVGVKDALRRAVDAVVKDVNASTEDCRQTVPVNVFVVAPDGNESQLGCFRLQRCWTVSDQTVAYGNAAVKAVEKLKGGAP
jgi:hypothetical protein